MLLTTLKTIQTLGLVLLDKVAYACIPSALIDFLSFVASYESKWSSSDLLVETRTFSTGTDTLQSLEEDSVDFATTAGLPFILSREQNRDFRVIAKIASASSISILALRSSDISSAQHLLGKKIGVSLHTDGEYFLDTYLGSMGLSPEDYQKVNISPDGMSNVLVNEEVAAVCSWQPILEKSLTSTALGDQLVEIGDRFHHRVQYMLVAKSSFLRSSRESVKRLLRGLIAAEMALQEDVDYALRLLSKYTGLTTAQAIRIANYFDFRVCLDRDLLSSLQQMEHWMRGHNNDLRIESNDWSEVICPEFLFELSSDRVSL